MIEQINRELELLQAELQTNLDPTKVMHFNQLTEILDYFMSQEKTIDQKIAQDLQIGEEALSDFQTTKNKIYLRIAYDQTIHASIRIEIALKDGNELADMQNWITDLRSRLEQYR